MHNDVAQVLELAKVPCRLQQSPYLYPYLYRIPMLSTSTPQADTPLAAAAAAVTPPSRM